MQLRDYQDASIAALYRWFDNNPTGHPLVLLPTGTGKSVVIAAFIARTLQRWPGQRIMMLTHVKELIEQNLSKLLAVWPGAPVGVYSAGLKRRQTDLPIVYAGIDSVADRADEFRPPHLIIVDEAHLVNADEGTRYAKFFATMRERNPSLRVIGLSATGWRMTQGRLVDAGLFTHTAFDGTSLEAFNWFLDQGYLCPLIPKYTSTQLDTAGVAVSGGEYNLKQLQAAIDDETITVPAVEELLTQSAGREHGLIFAAGVNHALHICDILRQYGESAVVVHSKMKPAQRDEALSQYYAGRYRWAVNNNILTTGIDYPLIDVIGVMRPTRSPGLWVQMLGRGTRPVYAAGYDTTTAPGRVAAIANSVKPNCLVLDFAGNSMRLGPINDPVIPAGRKGQTGTGAGAPIRLCKACDTINHASARFCMCCGTEFVAQVAIEAQASEAPLIRTNRIDDMPTYEWAAVDLVTYSDHLSAKGNESLRVTYLCGLLAHHEYIPIGHTHPKQRQRAAEWWSTRSDTRLPSCLAHALEVTATLRKPRRVQLMARKASRYIEVVDYEF